MFFASVFAARNFWYSTCCELSSRIKRRAQDAFVDHAVQPVDRFLAFLEQLAGLSGAPGRK